MKSFSRTFLALFLLSMFMYSCRHESELLPGIPEISFDSQILPVIQSNCAKSGCHDGSKSPDLNTYEDIVKLVDPGKPIHSKLHKVITAKRWLENAMPPKPNEMLSDNQIDNINIWILQGANHTPPSTECDSVNVTFNGSILPIIETNCKGCHSGSDPQGGLLLIDYSTIKASIDGGRFEGAIEQWVGYSAMPKNAAKLSDCDLGKFRQWKLLNYAP